ncbi:hypothetical protein ACZ87_01872 [Candidatus Erwinia dacicola]|uniref:Uncharacterized protein n=1 Tax=Candidatus Erwinia dacicola TaxID=252393 RepID=A0A328TPJ9_9GAMM|nr:hypothetical protein ACZ87_01872 [Candidatus Erwinia dacicola]
MCCLHHRNRRRVVAKNQAGIPAQTVRSVNRIITVICCRIADWMLPVMPATSILLAG